MALVQFQESAKSLARTKKLLKPGEEAIHEPGTFTSRTFHSYGASTESLEVLANKQPAAGAGEVLGFEFTVPNVAKDLFVGLRADGDGVLGQIWELGGMQFPVLEVGVHISCTGHAVAWCNGAVASEISELGIVHYRRRGGDRYTIFVYQGAWYLMGSGKVVHHYKDVSAKGSAYIHVGNGSFAGGGVLAECRSLGPEASKAAVSAIGTWDRQRLMASRKLALQSQLAAWLPPGARASLTQGHRQGIRAMAIAGDGDSERLLTAAGDGLKCWCTRSGRCERTLQNVDATAVGAWGDSAVVGTAVGLVLLVDLQALQETASIKAHSGFITDLRIYKDNSVSCCNQESVVRMINLETRSVVRTFDFKRNLRCIDIHQHVLVAVGYYLYDYTAFDIDTGKDLGAGAQWAAQHCWALAIGTDGHVVGRHLNKTGVYHHQLSHSSGEDKASVTHLSDLTELHGARLEVLRIHGPRLFSCSADMTVRVSSLEPLCVLHTIVGHNDTVNALVHVEPDILFSGSQDGVAMRWDTLQHGSTDDLLDVPSVKFKSTSIVDILVPFATWLITQVQLTEKAFTDVKTKAQQVDVHHAFVAWLVKLALSIPFIFGFAVAFYSGFFKSWNDSASRVRAMPDYAANPALIKEVQGLEKKIGYLKGLFTVMSGVAFIPATTVCLQVFSCAVDAKGVPRFILYPQQACDHSTHLVLELVAAVALVLLWSAALPLKIVRNDMVVLTESEDFDHLSKCSRICARISGRLWPPSLARIAGRMSPPWAGEFTQHKHTAYYMMATTIFGAGASCASVLVHGLAQGLVFSLLSTVQVIAGFFQPPFAGRDLSRVVQSLHLSTLVCSLAAVIRAHDSSSLGKWIVVGGNISIWTCCIFLIFCSRASAAARKPSMAAAADSTPCLYAKLLEA